VDRQRVLEVAPLPDGNYIYRFKIRDKSPRRNETPCSTAETVVVSPMTGYHDCPPDQIARRPEGSLVRFQGKVEAVEPGAYVVTAGRGRVRVVPRTVGGATDPRLAGQNVKVTGCVWTRGGDKQVVWAEVK